jgi:hypothetical protein
MGTLVKKRLPTARLGWGVVFGLMLLVVSSAGAPARAAAHVGTLVPASVMARLAAISHRGLLVTLPPNNVLMNTIAGGLVHPNHPEIVYVGADYCPYCAALRWPLILALLRFGSLHGLEYMRSSSTDVFADTATFSFYHVHYQSSLINFSGYETATRTGQPLVTPPHAVRSLFNTYDAPPFAVDAGAIPFLYLNGHYIISGSPVYPAILHGDNWSGILAALGQPANPIFQKIIPEANLLTAAFCQGMAHPPRMVCSSPGVMIARRFLPKS